jgi:hypothetical protein
MDRFQSLSSNRLLFDLASRLGSLEGYLYAEEKVDASYFPNWLQNIEREFNCVAPAVQNEIKHEYVELLGKVQDLLRRLYGETDANTAKVAAMIAAVTRGDSPAP